MITPAIHLTGRCEEAIRYYERIFSTKADFILRYGDAESEDWKAPLTEEQKKYVYHAEMKIRGQRFMFSDILEFPIVAGNSAFFIATYSSAAGNLVDKFGVRWGLMTERAEGWIDSVKRFVRTIEG
jgi:PhnB protein